MCKKWQKKSRKNGYFLMISRDTFDIQSVYKLNKHQLENTSSSWMQFGRTRDKYLHAHSLPCKILYCRTKATDPTLNNSQYSANFRQTEENKPEANSRERAHNNCILNCGLDSQTIYSPSLWSSLSPGQAQSKTMTQGKSAAPGPEHGYTYPIQSTD